MASEIRVNQIQSRTGVSTISFTDTGPILAGVSTVQGSLTVDENLTVDGNLNIDGVITYADVTNVDAIGVVTARSGVNVGTESSGTLITGNSNGIGIGTDNPSSKLSINGVIESLGQHSAGHTTEGGQLVLRAPSQQVSGTKYRYSVDVKYSNARFARPVGSEVSGIRFIREDDATGANGETLLSIGEDGIMSLPYLPCFRAKHNNSTLTTGTLVYNLVATNIGNHYNSTNGRFTAPINGFYSFKAHTLIQHATAGEARMALYKNGTHSSLGSINIVQKGANQWETIHVNGDFYLNAGDYITVVFAQNPSTVYQDSNYTGFSGFLVG